MSISITNCLVVPVGSDLGAGTGVQVMLLPGQFSPPYVAQKHVFWDNVAAIKN